MYEQVGKTPEKKSQSVSNPVSQRQNSTAPATRFVDNRPEAIQMRKLRDLAKISPQNAKVSELHHLATAHSVAQKKSDGKQGIEFEDNRPEAIAQRKLKHMMNNSPQNQQFVQFQKMENEQVVKQEQPIQKKEKNTGLPDNLKSGIENLSGYSMDDVKVHYNSEKPAQLNAHAYAQGTDIHLASGQEKHLPHEAWHVVQQKQGRVKPTMQMKGMKNINDEAKLEHEADVMGAKALNHDISSSKNLRNNSSISSTVQRYTDVTGGDDSDLWLLSTSGNILISRGSQTLYATREEIIKANEALANAGSFIRLREMGNCPHEPFEDFFRVMPIWASKETLDDKSMGKHQDARKLTDMNAESRKKQKKAPDGKFFLWADCSKSAQAVIGSKNAYQQDAGVSIGHGIGLKNQSGSRENLGTPGKFGENYGNSLYSHGLSDFMKRHIESEGLIEGVHYRAGDEAARVVIKAKRPSALRIQYDLMAPELRNQFDQTFGTNRYADPSVGEAYLTATEPYMREGGGDWVYHWGGVIMSDGPDRVTLEGFSVGLSNTISADAWTFHMYGTKGSGKTFHERQVESGHHGSRMTTMVVSTGITSSEQGSSDFEKADKDVTPAQIDEHDVVDAGGAGAMNCLIHAIMTAVGVNPEERALEARQFLVANGVAQHGQMLDLAGEAGHMLIAYLRSQNLIAEDRGVRAYYNTNVGLQHADVVPGGNPISVFLNMGDAHFYAVKDN